MRNMLRLSNFELMFGTFIKNSKIRSIYSPFNESCTFKLHPEINSSETLEIMKSSETPTVIKENTTEILVHPGRKVFYNPVQEFNRDLSVLALQVYSKQFSEEINEKNDKNSQKPYRILEALSATGLRSIRYAKEVPGVTEVIANDISSEAVKNLEINIKHNKVEHIVTPSLSDAVTLMINNARPVNRFQVIDLDPYGSPAPFLDSAVQSVVDGGMLLVTCTDMSVLCGVYPETCYAKYGALSLKIQGKHEMAIRIVLQHIQSQASRYKRYIVPLLSVSVDFYVRIFVKIYTSASACKDVISKLSMIYECCGCEANILQPLGLAKKSDNDKNVKYVLPHLPVLGGMCRHCGGAQRMGGPLWNGPIHDQSFVAEMIKSIETSSFATSKRLLGVLTVIQEELSDVPLYYINSDLASKIKSKSMSSKTLRSAILNAGYRVSLSHAAKESIKTNAPMGFIWDMYKCWIKENPINEKSIVPGSPSDNILKSPIQNKVDFSLRPDAIPDSLRTRLVRYQINPLPNWGPGSRATVKYVIRHLNKGEKKRKETPSFYGDVNKSKKKKDDL